MENEHRITATRRLHYEIMTQLKKQGFGHIDAGREALRRMEASPQLTEWRDFFTAVEVEGYSLPH